MTTVLDTQVASLDGEALTILAAQIQQAGTIELAIAARQQALASLIAIHEDLKLQVANTNASLIAVQAQCVTELANHQARLANMTFATQAAMTAFAQQGQ